MQSPPARTLSATVERTGEFELPLSLWLGVPPLLVVAMGATSLLAPDAYHGWFKVKEGPVEWATVVVLLPAIAAGIAIWRRRAVLPARWLGWWMALVGLGSFYYAGEELSWGQQIWHWETPDLIAGVNRQRETNLHNLRNMGIFESVPRSLLEAWIVVGGILHPLGRRRRGAPADPASWRWWFWPTICCVPTAVLAVVIRLPDRIDKATGKQMEWLRDLRLSEPQEFYFALFLAMYLLSVWARLRRV